MASAVKRSKWDNQEDSELVVAPQPPLKRRQKAVHHSDVSLSGKRPATSVFVPQRTEHPPLTSSRSVYSYEKLNSIEEGSYGVVFRARDKQTGDIVALKKLKLDEEKYGFPITALREINALMVCRHDNVVRIREVVVGETLTQYAL
jgi:cell division cycle 2-like